MQVPDCNNHGNCFNGECQCSRGYTGNACQQGMSTNAKCLTKYSFYVRNSVIHQHLQKYRNNVLLFANTIGFAVFCFLVLLQLMIGKNFIIRHRDDNSLFCVWQIFQNWISFIICEFHYRRGWYIIHYFVFGESSQIECCCWRCCRRCIKQSERKCEMDGVLYNSLPEKRKQKLLQINCF